MKGVLNSLDFRWFLRSSVLFFLLLPVGLSAQNDNMEYAEEFVDPFDESEFDRFHPEQEDGEELPLGQDPETSEILPEMRAVPQDDVSEAERPTEAVELRFEFDEPMRYDVNNNSRMGFADRPGLRQIYHSGMAIEYRPLTEMQRTYLPSWRMDVEAVRDEEAAGQIVLATVSRFSGSFDEPHELSDSARTHQVLKDAAFSFRISPRGDVTDVLIHPPTNPLVRSSLEEIVRLLASSHPVLPEEAVEPGDHWSQTIELSYDDESVVKAHEVELQYHFKEWARCGNTYCARIDVEQDVKAAGRLTVRHLETQSASSGGGSGWFLLDPDRGRILRSSWNLDTQGNTITRRRKEDTVEEIVNINFNLAVDTTIRLIERTDPGYRLVPADRDN